MKLNSNYLIPTYNNVSLRNNPNFNGTLHICEYDEKGNVKNYTYNTSKQHDKLVKSTTKIILNSSQNGEVLSAKNSNIFTKLIESMIFKKLKETNQDKHLSCFGDKYITYRDNIPENNGIFVKYDFDN